MTGPDLCGWKDRIPEESLARIATGRLHRVPGGLHEVFLGRFPRGLTSWIQRLIGIKEVQGIGMLWERQPIAVALFCLREEQEIDGPKIEEFITQHVPSVHDAQIQEQTGKC